MAFKGTQHMLAGLALIISANAALATNSFNPANNQLSLDSVVVNGATYNNVVVTINSYAIISVGSTSTSSGGTLTLAQLNACPTTSASTSAQFFSCFSGTLTGVELGQTFPCTLNVSNGQVTLATTDQNLQISFTPYNPSYYKFPSSLPSFGFGDATGTSTIGANAAGSTNLFVTASVIGNRSVSQISCGFQ